MALFLQINVIRPKFYTAFVTVAITNALIFIFYFIFFLFALEQHNKQGGGSIAEQYETFHTELQKWTGQNDRQLFTIFRNNCISSM